MRVKRAPLLGAGILLLIMIVLSIFCIYKNSNLITANNALQMTVDEHMNTIETLNKANTELTEQVTELETKIIDLEEQLANKPYAVYRTDTGSRSQTERNSQITLDDRETIARLVFLEANTESLECQKAIASVVINRVNSGYWGNTVNSVVYAKNQFTPASKIPYTTPTATNYEAVDYVLKNGSTFPSYVLYFRAGYHFNWSGYVPYTSMGNTYFGYMAKDAK